MDTYLLFLMGFPLTIVDHISLMTMIDGMNDSDSDDGNGNCLDNSHHHDDGDLDGEYDSGDQNLSSNSCCVSTETREELRRKYICRQYQ